MGTSRKRTADALTKVEGAHFAPMARLLNTSKFSIKEESDELLGRKQTKETLGYVPRPRSSPMKAKGAEKDPKRLASRSKVEFDLGEMC